MKTWKQNSESWQHKEQDKIRNQAGGCWVYRDACSWERFHGTSQHLYRLYPKSSCHTASATQHLPLHIESERSPCCLPCSSICQPKATLTRAKVRLGLQGNTCSCYGKGALAAVTSSQGACAPAALSSHYRTKRSAAGTALSGNPRSCSACQACQWKTSATNAQQWSRSVITYKHPHRVRHPEVRFSSAGSKNVTLHCCLCKIITLTFSTIQIQPGR